MQAQNIFFEMADRGRKQGKITTTELMVLAEQRNFDAEIMWTMYKGLKLLDIEIVEDFGADYAVPDTIEGNEIWNMYLQEIRKIEPITPEEEAALLHRIKEGSGKAAERLALTHLRLVFLILSREEKSDAELSEQIQAGALGIIDAIENIRSSPECRFFTWVAWWIRNRVHNLHSKDDSGEWVDFMVYARLYKRVQELMSRYSPEKQQVLKMLLHLDENTACLSPREIAEQTQMPLQQVRNIMDDVFRPRGNCSLIRRKKLKDFLN